MSKILGNLEVKTAKLSGALSSNLNTTLTASMQSSSGTGSGNAKWGSITGTLSDQSDLNTALGNKASSDTVTAIGTRVTTAEGNISTLTTGLSSVTSRVATAEGNISTLTTDVDSIEARVEDVEGDVTTLTTGLSGVTARVTTAEGNISTLSTDVDSIEARVEDVEGDVTTLTTGLSGVTARVTTAEGNISTLTTNVNGISTEVTNARGQSSTLRQELQRIESSVGSSVNTYRQATVPTANEGDLWYCTADVSSYTANQLYRYNGSAWELCDMAPSTLNTTIGQYIDSSAGTAKVVTAASGTYLSKTDASSTYETKTNVAAIETRVSANESNIDLVVDSSGSTASIKVGAIVDGVNNSGSTVQINADKIKMTGTTTFLTKSSADTYYDAIGAASTAQSTAISTAASDATTKANAAQATAISTAASDATTKANAAQSAAEATASADATSKANAALSSAQTYADTKAAQAQAAAEATAATDAATKAQAARTGAKSDVDAALAAGTTTISGDCITTGTVNANLITTGTMAADRISGGSLVLGGANNSHGQLYIRNASDETIGTWNNTGIEIADSTASTTTAFPTFRIRKTDNTTGGAYMGIWNPTILGDDPALGYVRLDGTYDDVTRNSQMIILPYSISMEQTVNSVTHSLVITPTTGFDTNLSGTVYNSGTLQYYSTNWGKMNTLTLELSWYSNFTMPADTNIFTGTITSHLPYWGPVYATAHQVDSTFKAWIDTSGNVVVRNSTAKTVYGTTTSGVTWHYMTVTFNYLEE